MKAYVLDTDVLVAAFRSDTGASRQVLEAARARRFDLLLSVPLMLEYESVLTRPEHLAASGASREDGSAVLDELASVGKRVELLIRTRPMLLDSNDEMVLETGIKRLQEKIIDAGLIDGADGGVGVGVCGKQWSCGCDRDF
jgi:predicted nucleic acid-binding protein